MGRDWLTRRVDGHNVRPEIQALRALAVTLVVVYHMEPRLLPGGFIGVDVFFVISGFLISAHIAKGVEQERFTLTTFYVRRARRLLPAALAVLAVVGIVTLVRLPETAWNSTGQQIVASALYFQNWLLAASSVDYLAAATSTSPLEHFWSLSLEEQFYLFWPLSVIVAGWVGKRTGHLRVALVLCVFGITAASFAYSIWETNTNPSWAYFVTPTRIWELGVGGLLALTIPRLKAAPGLRIAMSWLGLLAIGASAFLLNGSSDFPGYVAAVPVLGTAVVITAGDPAGRFSTAILANHRATQFVGDISYSIYLWHWPFIVLAPMVIHGPGYVLPVFLRPLPVLVSIAVAWLSKRYIEDPFRVARIAADPSLGRSDTRPALLATFSIMAVTLLIGSTLYGVSQRRIDKAFEELAAFRNASPQCAGAAALETGCFGRAPAGVQPDPVIATRDATAQGCQQTSTQSNLMSCDTGNSSGAAMELAVVGDSHANQWRAAIDSLALERKWHVTYYLMSGCPFADELGSATCRDHDRILRAHLQQHPVDVLITSARSGYGYGSNSGYDESVDAFTRTWRNIVSLGTRVIAIADTPQPVKAGIYDPPSYVESGTDSTYPLAAGLGGPDALVGAAHKAGVALIDMNDKICVNEVCPPVIGGVLVNRDADHLTSTYSKSLAPDLGKEIDEALAQ